MKLISVILAAAVLSGCQGFYEKRIANTCSDLGYPAGSPLFLECFQAVSEENVARTSILVHASSRLQQQAQPLSPWGTN